MKNELLTIGPFTIYGYGFMIAIGVLAGWFTAEYRSRKHKMEADHVFFSCDLVSSGGIPGSKNFVLDH